jgi:hypothetical protein
VTVEGLIEREGNIHWMRSGRLVGVLSSVEELRSQLAARSRPKPEMPGQLSLDNFDE